MKNKDFYNFLKSVDTEDGMFISDKFEDMPNPKKLSEIFAYMKAINQCQKAEKARNDGKLISCDPNALMPEDPSTFSFYMSPGEGIGCLTIGIILLIAYHFASNSNRIGLAFGSFYIMIAMCAFLGVKHGKKEDLPLAILFLVCGIGMILSELSVYGRVITVALFSLSCGLSLMFASIARSQRKKRIQEIAIYPIEALCVKHVSEIKYGNRDRYEVIHPVFEINYLGMTKRLQGYQTYYNLPNIGEKRTIYINPGNFSEWYDPMIPV